MLTCVPVLFRSAPVPGSLLPVAANITLPRTCLYVASANRMEALWELGMVRHRRCVDRLSFLLLPFGRGTAESACVPKEGDTSENILYGPENLRIALSVTGPMVRHGHSGSVHPWSGMAMHMLS